MRLLALETSGRLGSVALLDATGGDGRLLAERLLPAGERTARSLLPAVDQLLREHAWRPADLQLIGTTTGPGSFTGLRIGVVAAKTLAYATGAALVGVHTLAAIAENVAPRDRRLWTLLDAQRQELFAAVFEPVWSIVDQATPATEILAIDQWLDRLRPGDLVAGPPLTKLRDRLPPHVDAVDPQLWLPTAAAAGRLAAKLHQRGVRTTPLELVPHYYRQSAAEEKKRSSDSGPRSSTGYAGEA
jgi:tRNA threonylcarbamoyladenosine biosynthesis protein TsaB